MERLQPAMERVGIWRSKRFKNNTEQIMETGRSYVQQVTCIVLRYIFIPCNVMSINISILNEVVSCFR